MGMASIDCLAVSVYVAAYFALQYEKDLTEATTVQREASTI